jgi:hypothetical protein
LKEDRDGDCFQALPAIVPEVQVTKAGFMIVLLRVKETYDAF